MNHKMIYTTLAKLVILYPHLLKTIQDETPNLTCCPECWFDDFTHVESCSIGKMLDEWEDDQEVPDEYQTEEDFLRRIKTLELENASFRQLLDLTADAIEKCEDDESNDPMREIVSEYLQNHLVTTEDLEAELKRRKGKDFENEVVVWKNILLHGGWQLP